MSHATKIAKAVVSALNNRDFSLDFEAVYLVKPGYDLAELDILRVAVVPKTLEIDCVSRASSKYTVSIDIGVMRRNGNLSPEEAVETLGGLVDEISEFLKDNELESFPEATFEGITNDPIYSQEYLTHNRTFMSVLNVKYVLLD